ncbi:DNA internalization-related competence protein ComEC/Rec2, partial [bacterium]|nr:DNA internalization-related competence protein ComEC/Rec2 [bacterium]
MLYFANYLKRPFLYIFLILCAVAFYQDNKPQNFANPTLLGKSTNFTGIVEENQTRNQKSKLVVRLNEGSKILLSIGTGISTVNTNDIIQFTTKLKEPINYKNPGGFDYVKYLKRQEIGMTGFVENAEAITLEQERSKTRVSHHKENIKSFLKKNFSSATASTLVALMWGEDDLLSPQIFDLFNNFGISHILVISGSHFALLTAAFFFIFRFLLGFYPRLFLFIPSQKITALVTLVAATAYYFLCESSPSLLRAYIGVSAVLISLILSRKNDWLNLTFMAASLILAFNPLLLFNLSFELSFLCVLTIILVYPVFESFLKSRFELDEEDTKTKIKSSLLKLIALNTAIFIILTPFTAYHFKQITWGSLITNLWVVPVMELAIVPLALLGFLIFTISSSVAYYFFYAAAFLLENLIALLKNTQNAFTTAHLAYPPYTWELILYFVLMLILFSRFRQVRFRKIAVTLILIIFAADLLFWTYRMHHNSSFVITQLDVGQGDSILVEVPPNKKMLIDGGGAPFFDLGKNVIIPFLLYKRISKLDTVVITHSDMDHYGGLNSVVDEYPVDEIWWNGIETDQEPFKKLEETILRKKIPVQITRRGQNTSYGDGVIDVLWPPIEKSDLKDNNESVVLKIAANGKKALFTGDIEWPAEYALINDDIKADYLKVPHHGSKTSSTDLFLDKVKPEVASLG